MTTCKIKHGEAGAIPVKLCRVCNPVKTAPIVVAEDQAAARLAEQSERMERRQRRKLRAERKQVMGEIDKIAGRNPKATAELQVKLDAVNRELFLVT